MDSLQYDWLRYWYPRGYQPQLSPQGFLIKDAGFSGLYKEPDTHLKSLDDLNDVPCLVLLGEPGIGKSTEIELHSEKLASQSHKHILSESLSDFESVQHLRTRIFEENTNFKKWLRNDYPLYIFLDAVDEGRFEIKTLSTALAPIFETYKAHLNRLRLRITSRTAEWPLSLEKGLAKLFEKENVHILELAPLGIDDVIIAAQNEKLNEKTFLDAIENKQVGPFASKPLTLKFLIQEFKAKESLTSSRLKLYERGVMRLCEEINPVRLERQVLKRYTAHQRFVVCARIAALLIFSNKAAVFIGNDPIDAQDSDVDYRGLFGYSELIHHEYMSIDESVVLSSLSSSLFIGAGKNRLKFSHKTFQEFLASWYLTYTESQWAQIQNLLVLYDLRSFSIPSQLHGIVSWLSESQPSLINKFIDIEPDVLLSGDLALAPDTTKKSLLFALLEGYKNTSLELGKRNYEYLQGLSHSELAIQLKPYIIGRDLNLNARAFALRVAQACKTEELELEIAGLAMDRREEEWIRVSAASFVVKIGGKEAKLCLLPMAKGQAGDDPEKNLKARALRALWPKLITTVEFFDLLRGPEKNHYGDYYKFLVDEVPALLSEKDWMPALNWVASSGYKNDTGRSHLILGDKIIIRTWDKLHDPDILKAFVKACESRISDAMILFENSKNGEIFFKQLYEQDEKRRSFTEAYLSNSIAGDKKAIDAFAWAVYNDGKITNDEILSLITKDLEWIIEKMNGSGSSDESHKWMTLLERVVHSYDPVHIEVIKRSAGSNELIKESFGSRIKLDSRGQAGRFKAVLSSIGNLKKDFSRLLGKYKNSLSFKKDNRKYRLQISKLIKKRRSNVCEAWVSVSQYLNHDVNGKGPLDAAWRNDITLLPGWSQVTQGMKNEVLELARDYLKHCEPNIEEWLSHRGDNEIALAGYRAWQLLYDMLGDSFADDLGLDWKAWAQSVVSYRVTSDDLNKYRSLLEVIYEKEPDEVITAIRKLIISENKKDKGISLFNAIDNIFDSRIANSLMGLIDAKILTSRSIDKLLRRLMLYEVHGAVKLAKERFYDTINTQEYALVFAKWLLMSGEEEGWEAVWPIVKEDVGFGEKLLSAMADRMRIEKGDMLNKLPFSRLGDLYIFLEQQYPRRNDTWPNSNYGATALRGEVFDEIQRRGLHDIHESPSALDTMRRIAEFTEDHIVAKNSILRLESFIRQTQWAPPTPKHVLEIIKTRDKRIVRTAAELQLVVLESLGRLESELYDETPAVYDLWNSIKKSTLRKIASVELPQFNSQAKEGGIAENLKDATSDNPTYHFPLDENPFSDYIKRFIIRDLKQRAIIVNREVEIRKQDRVDLRIEAIASDSNSVVAVIVEVKGSWHKELETAMSSQLANRYLSDNSNVQDGIYLVGWFTCEKWHESDTRKKKSPEWNLKKARENFKAQAEKLSKEKNQNIQSFVLKAGLP